MPARVLSSASLELSSVRTIVYRLQTAFQEALDLYHLVSPDPASGGRLKGCPGNAWPGVPNKVGTSCRWSPGTR